MESSLTVEKYMMPPSKKLVALDNGTGSLASLDMPPPTDDDSAPIDLEKRMTETTIDLEKRIRCATLDCVKDATAALQSEVTQHEARLTAHEARLTSHEEEEEKTTLRLKNVHNNMKLVHNRVVALRTVYDQKQSEVMILI